MSKYPSRVQYSHIATFIYTLEFLVGSHTITSITSSQIKAAFKYSYVPSFRGADCDTDHYLVAAKVRYCQQAKRAVQKFDIGRHNLKSLNDIKVKKV